MGKLPQLRPNVIRPLTRGSKSRFFQMHIYDVECKRLDSERSEILKRLSLVEERVKFVKGELHWLKKNMK